MMFVSQMAFHAKISDPGIGGTYMTLLNTISNFGKFVLLFKLVDIVFGVLFYDICRLWHVLLIRCLGYVINTFKCTFLGGS